MSKSSSSSSSGIGFTGLLTIVFITLKLLEITVVATWSWWWVLSPIWITTSIALLVLAVIGIIHFWPEKKRKQVDEPVYKIEKPKSRFMEKLDAAVEASERRKREQSAN